MTRDRLNVLASRTWGYSRRLDDLWRGLRNGQLHDTMMRQAIIEEYRAISIGLMEIHEELKRELPPED